MKMAIIADDLTGACDTGVQLVQYGLDVSVAIQSDINGIDPNKDVIIFNTDSRAMTKDQAYSKVSETCNKIKNMGFDIVYKKIDSTMRGNIGSEINAVHDIFHPDFIFISPAHPSNGRKVKNRIHYLNGLRLSETEAANDPKTPVHESDICKLIQQLSERRVEHLSYKDLRKDKNFLLQKLQEWKKDGITYITVDAILEDDLKRLINVVNTDYSSILSGSAGLINYLPQSLGYEIQEKEKILTNDKPVLFVIGSISKVGRKQLEDLLMNSNVVGVEMDATKVITDDDVKENELKEIKYKVNTAIMNGKSAVLYSSSDLTATIAFGIKNGIHPSKISDLIADALGGIAVSIIETCEIRNLFLTGGDTAQQVFTRLGIKDYKLVEELELGVPIGKIDKQFEIITVTKAGSFGTNEVMTNALKKLHSSTNENDFNL